jgi:hypothetical protein
MAFERHSGREACPDPDASSSVAKDGRSASGMHLHGSDPRTDVLERDGQGPARSIVISNGQIVEGKRILFLMTDLQQTKYYYQTLQLLLKRGHRIHVAFFNSREPEKEKIHTTLVSEFPESFSFGEAPRWRWDVWHALCVACAWLMDYLLYFLPPMEHAHRLRERVEARIHPAFVWLVRDCPRASTPSGRRVIKQVLRGVYNSIPPCWSLKRFIKSFEPDVLLVTPLVFQGSLQSEYLRVARALTIPTGYCVASWDNLTTKGVIRGNPDRVLLWNEIQKQEAISLHEIAPEKIVVTGAQYFDDWFVRVPSRTREEFCKVVGLPAERPILLYMCSSNFMAPNEAQFVLRWLAAIRGCGIPGIAAAGILIRPYPKAVEQWQGLDLTQYGDVVVWPRNGEFASTDTGKMNFYDSVYHSLAVIGINTTAMIESAIIGRCVLTVLAPELNESQSNTIHFNYMRREYGGFLYLARDLEEHLRQLQEISGNDDQIKEEVARFVRSFVRPHGTDYACVPILAQAIEDLAHMVPATRRFSLSRMTRRCLLYPLAVFMMLMYLVTFGTRKQKKNKRKKLFQEARNKGRDPLEYVGRTKRSQVKS